MKLLKVSDQGGPKCARISASYTRVRDVEPCLSNKCFNVKDGECSRGIGAYQAASFHSKSASGPGFRRDRSIDCTCLGSCAGTGNSGMNRRTAWTVIHDEV